MTKAENGWLDVTLPITPGMPVWPGDPAVKVERLADMSQGDECNLTHLSFCVHTGTHLDAPYHFIEDGATVEQAPLDVLAGPVRVIDIVDSAAVRKEALEGLGIEAGSRVIFRTRNSERHGSGVFDENFVYIARNAAVQLAELGVRFVGIDGMSVGGFRHDMVETHEALLGAGIWVVENLDLREVAAGEYDMVCLPLKIVGADGAPARVILRRRG